MHINESPAPSCQLPALSSPVIPINQPFSTLTGPPTPVMQEVLRPPTPKISTPQRTRHHETPPITTPTRLHSHITPTKKADVGMLCVGFGTGTGIPAVIGSRVPMGTGTVLVFGTPRHTMYPYRGVTGISRVYYNINIIILTLFSHI